jgi:microcin C transport system substrate-binding protein
MTIVAFPESLSPGNEQREYWGSAAADEKGSNNLLGVKSKVLDELIAELVRAKTRADLVAHVHALDRVLQYGYYVIPQFHIGAFRVAYWNKFRRPQISPKYGIGFNTWWVDPAAAKAVEARKKALN